MVCNSVFYIVAIIAIQVSAYGDADVFVFLQMFFCSDADVFVSFKFQLTVMQMFLCLSKIYFQSNILQSIGRVSAGRR